MSDVRPHYPLWSHLAEEASLARCLGVSSSVEEEHSEVRLPFLPATPPSCRGGAARNSRCWASDTGVFTLQAGAFSL